MLMQPPVKIETSDKRPRTVGVVIVSITFGLFGLWAAIVAAATSTDRY